MFVFCSDQFLRIFNHNTSFSQSSQTFVSKETFSISTNGI